MYQIATDKCLSVVCFFVAGNNEHTPTFASNPYSVNVNEDANINDNVQLVVATDADDATSIDGKSTSAE